MRRLLLLVLLVISLMISCGGSEETAVTGEEVAAAFTEAGLEAERARPLTRDEYGAAPYVATGTRFFTPSLGEDAGGRIFVGDAEEISSLKMYYETLGEESAMFFSWVFREGNVLVQINGDMPEETARRYEQVLAEVVDGK